MANNTTGTTNATAPTESTAVQRYALVTGASGGIGGAISTELAKRGYPLVLVARNEAALNALAAELSSKYGVAAEVVVADLGEHGAAAALAADLALRGLVIDTLVNNAGFGEFGLFSEADAAKCSEMMQVNMVTLTELTRELLPGMVHRGGGRVMNLASTAAFLPGPLMAVYYATKAYVLSFSEAINNELHGTGVTVTAVCPGPTSSGFQVAAAMQDSKLVKDRKIMSASAVAKAAVGATWKGKPVEVVGLNNKLLAFTPRFMPRRVVPGFVRRAQAASH